MSRTYSVLPPRDEASIFTAAQIEAIARMSLLADSDAEAEAQVVAALGLRVVACCDDEALCPSCAAEATAELEGMGRP